jgi:VWFA-related protein
MKVVRAFVAVVILCGMQAPAAAQDPPGQPGPFRTGIELVTVDVTVIDRQGDPLRGLRTEDFTVSVGGQPRRVVSAEFIDRSATLQAAVDPEALNVSSNEGSRGGRVFLFVVDQGTLELGGGRRVAMAASHLLARLTPADRSGLMVMPLGPVVELTWAHHRVREALERIGGTATHDVGWEFGSLAEARDIASQNLSALRMVVDRTCGSRGPADFFAGPRGATPSSGDGGGQSTGGGGGGGGAAPEGGGGAGGAQGGRTSGFGSGADNRHEQCVRNVQTQAEMAWRSAEATTLASVTTLRQVLSSLARVGGDKTVVLIAGGWPLQERDQLSLLSLVATEAAAARATIFPFHVPASPMSASRRLTGSAPASDEQMMRWPLEMLASLTGGAAFRAHVGAEGAFDRLAKELAGHYRVGIERIPGDLDGKARQLKVQVARSNVTVRAREIFDAPAYEDRNWSARLNNALVAPAPTTGLGLRVTSYVAADREDPARPRLVLAGEVSRLHPGDATFQFVMRDQGGREFLSEEQFLGHATGDRLPFSVDVPARPGTYALRLAVMDAAGRVGSVDHRADVGRVSMGAVTAFGPMLVRLPGGTAEPSIALEGVRHGERLAIQVDLAGAGLGDADVLFEVATSTDGPALVQLPGTVAADPGRGAARAEVVADVRVLPPGRYVVRARVWAGGGEVGELRRAFEITGVIRAGQAEAETAAYEGAAALLGDRIAARVAGAVPPFALAQVLAPPVLGTFLDSVEARPEAASASLREAIDRVRVDGAADLVVPETLRAEAPAVSAFLRGLSLLAAQQLDPAASAFREAMRAAPDFYPAMVYLGACYAAGGKNRDAAGAWRTALIREGENRTLHTLLAEALLRDGRGDVAFQVLDDARSRWPDDRDIERRHAIAAIAMGRYLEGLEAVDDLLAAGADDTQLLELALLVLYEAFSNGAPVLTPEDDRARMTRFADAYRGRGGPSLALVERWMAAASGR